MRDHILYWDEVVLTDHTYVIYVLTLQTRYPCRKTLRRRRWMIVTFTAKFEWKEKHGESHSVYFPINTEYQQKWTMGRKLYLASCDQGSLFLGSILHSKNLFFPEIYSLIILCFLFVVTSISNDSLFKEFLLLPPYEVALTDYLMPSLLYITHQYTYSSTQFFMIIPISYLTMRVLTFFTLKKVFLEYRNLSSCPKVF